MREELASALAGDDPLPPLAPQLKAVILIVETF